MVMAYVPSKWILGFVPVGLFWILGSASVTGAIEADLTAHATAAVDATAFDNLVISAAGRDLTLKGAALTPIGPHIAYKAAQTVYGVRIVNADAIAPPAAEAPKVAAPAPAPEAAKAPEPAK